MSFLGRKFKHSSCALHGVMDSMGRSGTDSLPAQEVGLTSDLPDRKKRKSALGREAHNDVRTSRNSLLGLIPKHRDFMKAGVMLCLHCSETQRTNAQGLGEKKPTACGRCTLGEKRTREGGCEVVSATSGLLRSFHCTLNADAERIWEMRKVSKKRGLGSPSCLSLCPQIVSEIFQGDP